MSIDTFFCSGSEVWRWMDPTDPILPELTSWWRTQRRGKYHVSTWTGCGECKGGHRFHSFPGTLSKRIIWVDLWSRDGRNQGKRSVGGRGWEEVFWAETSCSTYSRKTARYLYGRRKELWFRWLRDSKGRSSESEVSPAVCMLTSRL